MDKYKVKVNPRAIRELDHIYEYIANEKRSAWIALRRVAIATFSAPPQCDPRGAFFTYQDNFNEISW
mgnify:CR=1 FL=1